MLDQANRMDRRGWTVLRSNRDHGDRLRQPATAARPRYPLSAC